MDIEHEVQLLILKELLFNPVARYSDLNKTGMTTDHFNFHVKRLIDLGVIEKGEDGYHLTSSGLEIASKLDLKNLKIVSQPKIGVLLGVFLGTKGKERMLLGERLRDPNLGKKGFFAGKVHLNEPLEQAATRVLSVETGLVPQTVQYVATVRILEQTEETTQMDRLMVYFKIIQTEGELIEKTDVSRNFWLAVNEADRLTPTFSDFAEDLKIFLDEKTSFEERVITP